MQMTITARHFTLTHVIRDHVEKACEKLERYFDQIINIHLTLSIENSRNIAEMSLHASHFNLQSQAEEMDMYIAIDVAIDKMEAQVKKLKDRVTQHQKKKILGREQFVYSNLFQRNNDKPKKMIKTKRMIPDILSIDEAMDKFDTHKDPYLIFKNVETDRINVLVKKDELHYKLIEP